MRVKKYIRKIHLVLGLTSGVIVCFLGITGCLLVFEHEIEQATQSYRYIAPQPGKVLPPSRLRTIAEKQRPGKQLHSVMYRKTGEAAEVAFYQFNPEYYYIVYLNPYTGEVLKNKDMSRDFFRQVINGHYYLWLPPEIGQPIVATATLIFFLLLVTGIILWWPRNRAARKQRFRINWKSGWRRRNYDLHNILGFYASCIAVCFAITGLVMGFQWFARGIYGITSGGHALIPYYEPVSADRSNMASLHGEDGVWEFMRKAYPDAANIEVHYPLTDSSAIVAVANPSDNSYWKSDFRYFDQYSLREMDVNSPYGRLEESSIADKIARMNYDIHVGAIGGLPTKILAFFASLMVSSLPVTGFLIWWGRNRKKSRGQDSTRLE